MIDTSRVVATDVHTHTEVSCRQPHDEYRPELDEAFARYFKSGHRPTIQETVDYYRSLNMAFVMFTVGSEHRTRPANGASRTRRWPKPTAKTPT